MKWRKFYDEEAKFKRYETDKPYVASFTSKIRFENLLDVGCGVGWLCRHYKEKGTDFVVGLDISSLRVKRLYKNCPECLSQNE